LDISGDIDVDGTTNLDVVDIDGAVNIAAATTVATDNKIQFRDTGLYINSSTDGQLDIVADTEVQIAATTVDINGAVDVSGNLSVGGNLDVTGTLDLSDSNFTNAGDIQLDSITGDSDTNTSIAFSGSDVITVTTGGETQVTFNNGSILPTTDNDVDLGSSSLEFKDLYIDGTAYVDAIDYNGTAITATAAELNIMDGVTSTAAELNILDGVTSTAAELNILDGVTSTAAELNILDGVTATTAEINLIDGDTSRGTTAVASGDGILINDAGTMRMTNVDTVSTYFASHSVGGGNIVTTGALNSGTITSGFGNINTGSSTITTTGAVATGALTAGGILKTDDTTAATSTTDGSLQTDGGLSVAADAVIGDDLFMLSDAAVLTFGADKDVTLTHVADTGLLLNGTSVIQFNDASQNIGAPSNAILDINATDEIELNATLVDINANLDVSGTVTATGTSVFATLDISGDVDVDGTLEADAITVNGTALAEVISDTVGAMVGSNTESGITVVYQDADNTLDFTVGTLNQNTTGSAATLTTARTIGGVSFNGSANINLPGVNSAGNQNTSGVAATATVLATARTIGGVSFNGSANINLPGVNGAGNQNTSGSAATLTNARTIGGVSFNGSANINLPGVNGAGNQNTSGVAATATVLATARTINGTSFNGSANITLGTGSVTHAMLAADCIDGDNIANDVINSEHYAAGSIDNEHIADDAINSEHYAAGSIDTAHIADGQITAGKLGADAVTAAKIGDDVINSEHYAHGSIDTIHIADAQITVGKMAANSINSDQYVDGSIDTAHLSADCVTAAKIGNDVINSEHYAANSIDEEHIANDAVGAAELKTLATLLILNEAGSTLRTFHCAGA